MNRRYYCLLIVLFFAVLIQAAAAERTYNILFIQSYTSQTPWHSDLNQGLVKGFKESGLVPYRFTGCPDGCIPSQFESSWL